MIEPARLLHNMSAPPKSVVKYAGLSKAVTAARQHETYVRRTYAHNGVFGFVITFRRPESMRRRGPGTILKQLGVNPGRDPEKTLLDLIEARAKELTLPDACVVVPAKPGHKRPWTDSLAALAIISKSSANIWLRSKAPRLSAIRNTTAISLLVPPAFTDQMEEISK